MEFRTKYSKPITQFSEAGSMTEPVFDWVVDKKTGDRELKIVGNSNLDAEIQSHRESCDLHIILSNLEKGLLDPSVLNRKACFYADTIGMPNSYAELFDKAQKAEQLFENLPLEIKEKFGNDYYTFWNSVDNGDFASIMSSGEVNNTSSFSDVGKGEVEQAGGAQEISEEVGEVNEQK